MSIANHDIHWNTDKPIERAMFRLAEAHFAVFNAEYATTKRYQSKRYRRGMQVLEHAFEYLNQQRDGKRAKMAAAVNVVMENSVSA